MRVVQVNTADTQGGAALAAYRLHHGLRETPGVEPAMLVGIKRTNDADIQPVYTGKAGYLASRLVHETARRLGLGSLFRFPPSQKAEKLIAAADMLHLHHIHGGFFSYPSLMRHARRLPTVWTLHDMWSFTGGCPYSLDCDRWKSGCGECPQKNELGMICDLSGWQWEKKRRAYRRARLTIVAPSRWLAELAKSSPLHESFAVHCIPNGIDTGLFKPGERRALRSDWDLPSDALIAMAQTGERKGELLLPSIIAKLPDTLRNKLVLMLVGGEPVTDVREFPEIKQLMLVGQVREQDKMAQLYGLADVFLHPSKADNLPNTLIESLACGTPAVTFNVGGCAEIVRHMETGYAARAFDCGDFSMGLATVLDSKKAPSAMRERCRQIAVNDYDISIMIRHYLNLYRSLMEDGCANTCS